jgi:histone-lysine N-methyltransferase SETMAR
LKILDEIRRKLPRQMERGVLLHHDNARPHTDLLSGENSRTTVLAFKHPLYSPDLAPSDFHLFGPLKKRLGGKRFADEVV